jgi:hypothetical protein
MIRGIEGRNIFRNKQDRKDFLDPLSNVLPKTETLCYAGAFRELGISLTELAKRLGISVAGSDIRWREAKSSPAKTIIS